MILGIHSKKSSIVPKKNALSEEKGLKLGMMIRFFCIYLNMLR